MRRNYKNNLRQRLLDNQSGRCVYCKRRITFTNSTFEHIIPKSKGGTWSVSNLVLCCEECNRDRDNENLNKWLSRKLGLKKVLDFEPIIKSYCLG